MWLERSTSRCCSIRHMLRPFSSSRLPLPPRVFQTRRSFLSRGYGIFSRTSPSGNIFVGLLCANHVTHCFENRITPARYRPTAQHMLLSARSAAAASSSAVDKQGVMKQTDLPVAPPPAPKGHSTFREDRESVTTYRHHGHVKSEFEREV